METVSFTQQSGEPDHRQACLNAENDQTELLRSDLIRGEPKEDGYSIDMSVIQKEIQRAFRGIARLSYVERCTVLQGIVNNIEYRDRSYLLAALPKIKDDPSKHLPEEVMLHIFAYLDPKELATVARVSKRWNNIGEMNHLWKLCYTRKRWKLPSRDVPWKIAFMRSFRSHQNWLRGNYRLQSVTHCNELVIAFSDDGWTCHSNGLIRDRHGVKVLHPPASFTTARFRGHYLIAGDREGWLYVYDLQTKSLKHSRRIGHHEVSCLSWVDGNILTGNEDGALISSDLTSERALGDQSCPIISLMHHSEYIISGNQDGRISKYDVTTGRLLASFQAHANAVLCLASTPFGLISGSADGCLRVWNSVGLLSQTIGNAHRNGVLCLEVHDDLLASAGADGIIKTWGWAEGTLDLKCSMEEHTAPIWSLKIKDNVLMSAGLDEKVIVWDFTAQEKIGPLQELKPDSCV